MIRGNNDPNEASQVSPIQQQKAKQSSDAVEVASSNIAAPSVISSQSPQFQSYLLQGQIQNITLPNPNNCAIQGLRLTTSQPGQSSGSYNISSQSIGRIYTTAPQGYITVSSTASPIQNQGSPSSSIQLRTNSGILPISVSPTKGAYQDASGMTIRHLGTPSGHGFAFPEPRDISPQRSHQLPTTMSVSHSGSTIHHLGQSPTRGSGIPPLATLQHSIQTLSVPDQIQQIQQRRPSSGNISVYSPGANSSKIGFEAMTTVASNFLLNTIHQTSPVSSITSKPKRIKLEEKLPSTPEIANYRKLICEYKQKELNTLKESYREHLTELFFLQNGGNMMDYLAWKKRPSPHLLTFLRTSSVDSEEEDERRIYDEVKVPASGGTPVAISTTLPAAVTQLTQQGGTPLIGEPQPSTTPILQPSLFTSQIVQKLQPVDSTPTQISTTLPTTTLLSMQHSQNNSQIHLQQRIQLQPQHLPDSKPIVSQLSATCVPKPVVSTVTTTCTSTVVTTTTSTTTTVQPKSSIRSPLSAPITQRLATRQHSISAVYDNSIGSQEQIVERAKQEAYVVQRIAELRKGGLWAAKRLPKVQEPPRSKAHWDYLLEEMQWLATDFAQERKWKKAAAKKFARTVVRYHQEQKLKEERAEREEANRMRKIASHMAKEIKQFWSNIEKIVQYKQQSRLEEKRKKALDLHLNFIVDQTEKYSTWLTKGLNKSLLDGSHNTTSSLSNSQLSSPSQTSLKNSQGMHLLDADFEPESESDDEETIEKEEQEAGEDNESQQKELELLQKEMEVPLEDLIKDIPLDKFSKSPFEDEVEDEKSVISETNIGQNQDEEFQVFDTEDSDDEETLDEEEAAEEPNHQVELDDLKLEGEMSIEDLYSKYAGAYDSDFEMPLSYSESSEVNSEENEDLSDNVSEDYLSDDDDDDGEMVEIGMDYLINPDKEENEKSSLADGSKGPSKEITDIAATAQSLQPTGNTLSTTLVCTIVPFLLKHQLREYQHIGLDWLVTMHDRKLNGILADEMGLGKTIQTIALLAHLACEKGTWGPHLIVVPTSVMLNWEMEFKKWCPSFKILTYYGSQKERKQKRQGWTKQNTFHICITSYKLVIQDHQSFRRKKWKYFILDEAQNIKNFKSQRWQTLLNFQSARRLLLTGTPLQNDLMELWSLMHFLMPHVFQSHRDFKEWFANPVTGMIEGSHEYSENLIKRLHKVLRPFLLRRLKSEVERQLPKKFEHVLICRLSKRQRFLYDDFMAQTKTKETLATGNFMSVINILMQLRKVCNHPNLFEGRPIVSPFQMEGIVYYTASLVPFLFDYNPLQHISLQALNLCILEMEFYLAYLTAARIKVLQTPKQLIMEIDNQPDPPPRPPSGRFKLQVRTSSPTVQSSGRASPFIPISPGTSQFAVTKSSSTLSTVPVSALASVTNNISQPILPSSQVHSQGHLQRTPSHLTQELRSATVLAASTHPQQLSGYTLQLIQPTQQGAIQVAHLTPANLGGRAVTSQSITLQVQQTQQGPRLTVPTTQLHQLPGFAQIVQTSSGQHIILTSATQLLQTVTTLPSATTTTTVTTSTIGQPAIVSTAGSLSNTISATTTVTRTNIPSTAALSLNFPATPLKPLMKVTPVGILASPHVQPQQLKPLEQIAAQAPVKSETPTTPVVSRLSDSSSFNKPETPNFKAGEVSSRLAESSSCKPGIRSETSVAEKSVFFLECLAKRKKQLRQEKLERIAKINVNHSTRFPIYGHNCIRACSVFSGCPHALHNKWTSVGFLNCFNVHRFSNSNHPNIYWKQTEVLKSMINTAEQYLTEYQDIIDRFVFIVPAVSAPCIQMSVSHPPPSKLLAMQRFEATLCRELSPKLACLHKITNLRTTQFPDLRLIQYDCGKLQMLDRLLRELKTGHHRALIFTQMTRMLDILEAFLNFHGHIYLRLDGTTRVEQRQALMERFNADKRIFCFILSTRSGGIGVNLTGADTVIFYDSDWNPTMDAQAQDRCHRIGQTRDVHIYRLISDKTVEENILKKANQKRLLGEVAIEGGNFTTAFFKKNTLSDLFGLNEDAIQPAIMKAAVEALPNKELPLKSTDTGSTDSASSEEKFRQIQFEQALCQAEDETDVQAAKIACAEAATELAEFDETIPLDGDSHAGDDDTKVEEELSALVEQLTPVERYAMNFLETCSAVFSTEQLKLAEEQIEIQKKDWELSRLQSLKEEEERRAGFEDNDIPYTCSREDAYNQIYVCESTNERMPMWSPPTPPQDDNDVYIDYSICFLYEPTLMTESHLPPIYVKKERKRLKLDPAVASGLKQKMPKNDHPHVPRSLFDRPTAAILKMRRDAKLQKMRGLTKPLLKPPPIVSKPVIDTQQDGPEWLVCEDWALLQAVQSLQDLPLNLAILSPAHIPNWDLVADIVNSNSRIFRSPKQCKNRYESVIVAREEGKILYDTNPKKPKKTKGIYRTKNNRPMRTSQLIIQDNNSSFTAMSNTKFELIKNVANKRTPTLKPLLVNPTLKNPKHAAVLAESGINYDQPSTPVQVAAIRAERIAREKQKSQQQASAEQQLLVQRQQQQVVQTQSASQTQAQQLQAGVALSTTTQILTGQLTKASIPNSVTAVSIAKNLGGPNSIIVNTAPGVAANTFATINKRMSQAGATSQATPSNINTTTVSQAVRTQRTLSAGAITFQELNRQLAGSSVVSVAPVSNLSAAQVAQRIVSGNLTTTPVTTGIVQQQLAQGGKSLTPQQLNFLRQQQALRGQQRLQPQLKTQQVKRLQQVPQQGQTQQQVTKATAVTLAATGVQVTQTQQRLQAQVQKQGILAAGQKSTVGRTMSEAEVTQLLKRQQIQKQQLANSQVLAPAQLQQQGASQVAATLVKTVTTPATLSTSSVTIPVNVPGVNISVTMPQAKTAQPKLTPQQQMRQQFQLQQLIQQRKVQQQPQQKNITQAHHVTSKPQIPQQLGTVQLLSHPQQKPLSVQNMQVLKHPLSAGQQLAQISTAPTSASAVSMPANQQVLQVIAKTSLAPVTSQVTQGQSVVSVATTSQGQRTMQVLAPPVPSSRTISATANMATSPDTLDPSGSKASPYSMRLRNIPKQ